MSGMDCEHWEQEQATLAQPPVGKWSQPLQLLVHRWSTTSTNPSMILRSCCFIAVLQIKCKTSPIAIATIKSQSSTLEFLMFKTPALMTTNNEWYRHVFYECEFKRQTCLVTLVGSCRKFELMSPPSLAHGWGSIPLTTLIMRSCWPRAEMYPGEKIECKQLNF